MPNFNDKNKLWMVPRKRAKRRTNGKGDRYNFRRFLARAVVHVPEKNVSQKNEWNRELALFQRTFCYSRGPIRGTLIIELVKPLRLCTFPFPIFAPLNQGFSYSLLCLLSLTSVSGVDATPLPIAHDDVTGLLPGRITETIKSYVTVFSTFENTYLKGIF